MISTPIFIIALVAAAVVFFFVGFQVRRNMDAARLADISGDPDRVLETGRGNFYIVPEKAEVKTFDSAIRYKIPLKRSRKKKVKAVYVVGDEVTEDLLGDPRSKPPETGVAVKAPVFPPEDD